MHRILIKSACHLSKCKTKKHISCGRRRVKATKQFPDLYVHLSLSQHPNKKKRKNTENSVILRQKILTVSSHEFVREKKVEMPPSINVLRTTRRAFIEIYFDICVCVCIYACIFFIYMYGGMYIFHLIARYNFS